MTNRTNTDIMCTIELVDAYYEEFKRMGKRIGVLDYVQSKFRDTGCGDISKGYITYCRSAGNLLRSVGLYQIAVIENWNNQKIQDLRKKVIKGEIKIVSPELIIQQIEEQTIMDIELEENNDYNDDYKD